VVGDRACCLAAAGLASVLGQGAAACSGVASRWFATRWGLAATGQRHERADPSAGRFFARNRRLVAGGHWAPVLAYPGDALVQVIEVGQVTPGSRRDRPVGPVREVRCRPARHRSSLSDVPHIRATGERYLPSPFPGSTDRQTRYLKRDCSTATVTGSRQPRLPMTNNTTGGLTTLQYQLCHHLAAGCPVATTGTPTNTANGLPPMDSNMIPRSRLTRLGLD